MVSSTGGPDEFVDTRAADPDDQASESPDRSGIAPQRPKRVASAVVVVAGGQRGARDAAVDVGGELPLGRPTVARRERAVLIRVQTTRLAVTVVIVVDPSVRADVAYRQWLADRQSPSCESRTCHSRSCQAGKRSSGKPTASMTSARTMSVEKRPSVAPRRTTSVTSPLALGVRSWVVSPLSSTKRWPTHTAPTAGDDSRNARTWRSIFGVPAIVVVQKGDVLARGDANTGVACGVPTSVLPVSKHANGDRRPERELLQSLLDRRRRAVVDDEQFDVRVGLCADARHCFANQRRTAVRRENDADERCVGVRSITHPEVSPTSFVKTAASGRRNRHPASYFRLLQPATTALPPEPASAPYRSLTCYPSRQ